MFMTSLGWWGVGTGVFDIITYYSKSFSHRHMPYRVFGMVFGGTVDAGSHGAHRRTDHERTTHSHRSEIGSCDPTKIEVASKKASTSHSRAAHGRRAPRHSDFAVLRLTGIFPPSTQVVQSRCAEVLEARQKAAAFGPTAPHPGPGVGREFFVGVSHCSMT